MSDFVTAYVTEPDLLAAHARLTAEAGALIEATPVSAYGDPTPCGDWDVRRVICHLAEVNEVWGRFAATGDEGEVDPNYPDPVAAFHEWSAYAARAVAAPGYLDEVRPTPIGEQPGRVLVQHLVNELIAHAWDLARATGASTDLSPDIAERSEASWRAFFAAYPREEMSNFGPETTGGGRAAADWTSADRMAAHLGRAV